ncbi:type III secretion system needle filament subunit SctF [Pectobacterium parvum]|uniref:EscF/YscF/HrpA family type III secretion system needle major subunit n=1 Tax=Pectobacterium parvum TaxID=2778550 RepID=A0AAP9IF54_9GAMM|nr:MULTISPECIES: type III secretion system needle filament subunit SctF [Pectobacterium]GKW40828.1 protein MxiH [Pectobacterium carotovorum subsp. carotovorum]KFX17944.1 type III secretion system needle complex protein PrgI [Pectobacterium parvum]MCU1800742.1 EscF/YscF/HrpA family type III secretion system needle major subunit [Pectobacterium parvum]QHQ23276.1 EscF/YscF/HrpA family type III secretion system needle major subunit [Pectobacterium parvum]UFK38940.1 type III secretion system needle
MTDLAHPKLGYNNDYFLDDISGAFEEGAEGMMKDLNAAQEELQKDPSNPAVLANYQAKLQEYTLFRSAQTSTVKAYKDIGASIIQNFR